ncbi:MAG: DNA topoisomerase (ATP-hydrolyzing) subunit A [Oscillospiraceae bacterium]|nr:DNA topoisomerase (ATP-hydrolyzing) subunit A [Oscillospiraceae bacterium]
MPKKRTAKPAETLDPNTLIVGSGVVLRQAIPETLVENYMPYAMSVILSRAIPEIDGFKPSHRKILYTMYQMGLLTGGRSKSANIVGRTMQLNPHGDAAIYETMVRLSRGYETLLHPFVDSKGNFGKSYSRDMMWAASRYTEAKLEGICAELFRDLDKNAVDFADNYDATMKEPTLLPVTFPSVLVNANTGIAVGMASSVCSFNLEEVCKTTIALMGDENHDIADTLKAPDFIGGGFLLYNREQLEQIYTTGRGSVRIRGKYAYDKSNNCIDITQIPPTTTAEAIIERIVDRAKAGILREVADVRDETDRKGLKITIDLKRGTDAEALMRKIFKLTTLEDSFSCNFNVLVKGHPRVLGIRELLMEWLAFRENCIRRRVGFELTKARDRLHLLQGLAKILLDIDKAIDIIRKTDEEAEVVPNLMIGFGIDKLQADFVAEIRLRHLNREYILKQTKDIDKLTKDIADKEDILQNSRRVRGIIRSELEEVIAKYAQPRRTQLLFADEIEDSEPEESVPEYPVHIFFTRDGYFKKITPQSLRMSGEQKLKENDEIVLQIESNNAAQLLFFTNKCQCYKSRAADFDDSKASVLGDFVPTKLEMEPDERPIFLAVTRDYSGQLLFFFENGKAAKVELAGYQTKQNRKKLLNAVSDKSPVVAAYQLDNERGDVLFFAQSTAGRGLIIPAASIPAKTTKNTQGIGAMTLRTGLRLKSVLPYADGTLADQHRYKTKNLPAVGAKVNTQAEQLRL